MGPYIGRVVQCCEINMRIPNETMWEVFDESGEILYFLETDHSTPSSWLSYINCARNDQEQNLEIYQSGREIYYRALKDIPPDQELLVWYSSRQDAYMGIPGMTSFSNSEYVKWKAESVNRNCKTTQHSVQSQVTQQNPQWNHSDGNRTSSNSLPTLGTRLHCVLCRRGFNSRSNLRSHMRIHTLEKPFVCKFCNRSFSQSSTLRNHTRLHTGEKPYRCTVCQSSYSQLAGLRAHQRSSRHRPHSDESFNNSSYHKQRPVVGLTSSSSSSSPSSTTTTATQNNPP
ncbi:PR domain zinc finger protein 12-like [Octopus sinensis]|uniref:PR domain zinc finger protein 12-like n=1 Tax=Octopus sinensis TaxID=2607531 RepID=A0A7E6FKH0_9MOLL|nr:PR domain zinc finger protein 12-like [Octopus sinensis]